MTLDKEKNGLFIKPQASLLEAMAMMDKNSEQLLIVTDEDKHLIGVVTDGDIRRAILSGKNLQEKIESAMNSSPRVAKEGELRSALIRRMKDLQLHFLPKIDDQNKVIDVLKFSDLAVPGSAKNRIVIMAGGQGTRLGVLTRDCPKPMLRMGGKPMLEILIELLASFGFYDFVISVHYLKEQIIDYFGDGSKFGVDISYLHEDEPLGTAGVLSSLELPDDEPFLVINGDIYTDMDFSQLMDSHHESGCFATMCVREFSYQIPFGVVKTSENDKVSEIEEKPELKYLINAGIYVFAPSVISLIPRNKFFLMTSLFEELLNTKKSVNSYFIDGFWLDIGHQDDLERASRFFY